MASKPSGLQRSRSSSCIPLSNRLSRPHTSASKGLSSIQKPRIKSVARPGHEKLTVDFNVRRSSSASNLNDLSRLSRQRSGSLVRQTLTTPLSVRSGKRSPLLSSARKDNRPISDKRWQYEQVVKVRTFVAAEFPHLDYNNIKSGLPLELFVSLMDSYFKMIDKRIKITRENYIEEVPANLRRYRYPATVKPSMMKTVNTFHCWPHVVAIFSWLTDILKQINCKVDVEEDLETLADNCCLELYNMWNNQDDTTDFDQPLRALDAKLVKMLNLDDDELQNLNSEISNLNQELQIYEERKQLAEKTLAELETNMQCLNGKCDTYLKGVQDLEFNLNEQHIKYSAKLKLIGKELAELTSNEDEIKTIISSQPYSSTQKELLAQEIKDLQNTIKLKYERSEQQKELIYKYDFKLSDIKQKVEASAYKYNNMVSQLAFYNKELKMLHIRESGFARKDTEDEIHKVHNMLNDVMKSFQLKYDNYIKKEIEMQKKQEELDIHIVNIRKEIEALMQLEAEMEINLQSQTKKNNKEREQRLQEMNKNKTKLIELNSTRCDLKTLREELDSLQERKTYLLKFKDDLKEKASYFFVKLESQVFQNVQNYMGVLEEISSEMVRVQELLIPKLETNIDDSEKQRKEIEEHKPN